MNPQQLFCEISFAPRTNIPTWTNQSTQEKRQRIKKRLKKFLKKSFEARFEKSLSFMFPSIKFLSGSSSIIYFDSSQTQIFFIRQVLRMMRHQLVCFSGSWLWRSWQGGRFRHQISCSNPSMGEKRLDKLEKSLYLSLLFKVQLHRTSTP